MRDDITADMAPLVPELLVSDFEKSLEFYRLLGFRVLYGRPEDGFAYLDRNGAQLMIEQRDEAGSEWIAGPLERPFGRGVNFQVDVEDAAALRAICAAAGVMIFLDLEEKQYRRDQSYLSVMQFIATDPDGYLIRLSEYLGSTKV